jgi:hypothetical protein
MEIPDPNYSIRVERWVPRLPESWKGPILILMYRLMFFPSTHVCIPWISNSIWQNSGLVLDCLGYRPLLWEKDLCISDWILAKNRLDSGNGNNSLSSILSPQAYSWSQVQGGSQEARNKGPWTWGLQRQSRNRNTVNHVGNTWKVQSCN